MKCYLINSAVLAAGEYGTYRYEPASQADLAAYLRENQVISRIGYPETAEVIERWTGIRPPLSREQSPLKPGDIAFVVRLRFRVPDPSKKGEFLNPRDEDWEIARLARLS